MATKISKAKWEIDQVGFQFDEQCSSLERHDSIVFSVPALYSIVL